MINRRGAAVIAAAVLLLGAAVVALSRNSPASQNKPPLLLLTSLPILFGEEFALDQPRSALLETLERRYRLVPIDVTDAASLARGQVLVMAQPRAQTADNLVALDAWVRGGGRLLLFADPLLEWPSERPLGDVTRPAPMFADTGLLGHWGLRLDAPDRRGPVAGELAGKAVTARSPGVLVRIGGSCTVAPGGLIARCPIGRGQAIVVADADLLDTAMAAGGDAAAARLLESL